MNHPIAFFAAIHVPAGRDSLAREHSQGRRDAIIGIGQLSPADPCNGYPRVARFVFAPQAGDLLIAPPDRCSCGLRGLVSDPALRLLRLARESRGGLLLRLRGTPIATRLLSGFLNFADCHNDKLLLVIIRDGK